MKLVGGLAVMLIAVGIGVMIWVNSAGDSLEKAKPALEVANQLAGRDQDGVRASDSIRLEAVLENNRLQYILVDEIAPNGPMATYYGLKRDDCIIQADALAFKGEDAQLCKDMVLQAFSTHKPLVVLRDGERLTLPATPAPGTTPPGGSALRRQLDAIPGIQR
jgi:hypothetical protein